MSAEGQMAAPAAPSSDIGVLHGKQGALDDRGVRGAGAPQGLRAAA
jgi:hypothetical protein